MTSEQVKAKVMAQGLLQPLDIVCVRGEQWISKGILWWEKKVLKTEGVFSHWDLVTSAQQLDDFCFHNLVGAQPSGIIPGTMKTYIKEGTDFEIFRMPNLTNQETKIGLKYVEECMLTEYDYSGIASFVFGKVPLINKLIKQNPKKMFCSEFGCNLIQKIGRIKEVPKINDPDVIFDLVADKIVEKVTKEISDG